MKLGLKQAKHDNKKSNNNNNFLYKELEKLKHSNLYRTLRAISADHETGELKVDGKYVSVHLCSNDYLGLSRNATILRETISSIQQISQCSSRLIAGNFPELIELEEKLAEHRHTQASLVYPTGYMANIGVITAIA